MPSPPALYVAEFCVPESDYRNQSPPAAPARPSTGGGEDANESLLTALIQEAVKVGNHQTKKEAVIAALQEYVQTRKRREILDWVGKVDYYDDDQPKRLRDRRPQ